MKKQFIEFSAEWCGPCKMQKPVIDLIKNKYSNQFDFIDVNIDKEPNLAARYNVQSIPTMIILDEKGSEKRRLIGFHTEPQVETALQ